MHDNGNRAGRILRGKECRQTCRKNDVDFETDQLGRKVGKLIGFRPTRADFEDVVFSLDVTPPSHTLPEWISEFRNRARRRVEEADSVNFSRLLRRGYGGNSKQYRCNQD